MFKLPSKVSLRDTQMDEKYRVNEDQPARLIKNENSVKKQAQI